MDDPQTKLEEAVRAFKDGMMNADPSIREKAKDPGFAAKWDVAVRWQLVHGPTITPATGAEVHKVPPPVLASKVLTHGASPDTNERPAPQHATPVPRTPSVSRRCVHGMDAIDCAPCSRSPIDAPILERDEPSRSSDLPVRSPAGQLGERALSVGDAVRHQRHGIGVVSESDANGLVVHFYPKGWARPARTQLELLEDREAMLAWLDGTWNIGEDRLKAAIICLRLDDASLYHPAALHFARCPYEESKAFLASYLRSVPLPRAQKVRARVREVRVRDNRRREAANRQREDANRQREDARALWRRAPGESADAHIPRVDLDLAETRARPLSAAQPRRMLQEYHNWCWKCHAEVSSENSIRCPACRWFVCVQCHCCSRECSANR